MKHFIVLILFTGSLASVHAQVKDLFKRKPWEDSTMREGLRQPLPKKITSQPYFLNKPGTGAKTPAGIVKDVYLLPLKGIYMRDNDNGDEVYAMSTDHMPCIVTGKSFHSNMPIAGYNSADKDKSILSRAENDKVAGDK